MAGKPGKYPINRLAKRPSALDCLPSMCTSGSRATHKPQSSCFRDDSGANSPSGQIGVGLQVIHGTAALTWVDGIGEIQGRTPITLERLAPHILGGAARAWAQRRPAPIWTPRHPG